MKYLKLFFAMVCLVITTGAVIYAISLRKKLEQSTQKEIKVTKAIEAEAEVINKRVDQYGRQHVIISATENTYSHQDVKSAVGEGILDTTANAIGILKKQIHDLTVINSTLKAENLKASVISNNGNTTYNYRDKYLDLSYKPGNPSDTLDKGEFDFKYDADLTITQYWKRKWLLAEKTSFIDIYSNDPRTTINGVKKLSIVQNQPSFGLRVQGMSSYNLDKNELSSGPGVQFDFKRFSLHGSYQYNFTDQSWSKVIQGRYDIVRF